MPVKTTFHQRARQEQLVDVAIALIGEGGLAAASTSAIARRAGISRGVVNYNVGDRDALMGMVIARVYELGAEAVGPAVVAAADPRAAIRAFVVASLDFYVDQPGPMRALREIFADETLVDRAGTSEHQHEVSDLADLLRAGQSAGLVRSMEVSLAVTVIRSSLDWAAGQLVAGEDKDRVQEDVLELLDLVLAAPSAG